MKSVWLAVAAIMGIGLSDIGIGLAAVQQFRANGKMAAQQTAAPQAPQPKP